MQEEFLSLMRDELNVKNVENIESIEDTEGWVVKKDGDLAVALDTRLTDALKAEGVVREFIRAVNALRKAQGLTIRDTVAIIYQSSDALAAILDAHADAIKQGTIASKLERGKVEKGEEIVLGEEKVKVQLEIQS